MSEYQHLKHVYRLCFSHHCRGVQNCGNEITQEVRNAMFSLVTPYPLPDYQGTLALIRNGGPKAEGRRYNSAFNTSTDSSYL